MPLVKKAIIIGGGPAGLAAAIRLKVCNGIETSVYELRHQPTSLGGAVSIPPNGLRLFQRLGLLEQLTDRGSSVSRFVLQSMHDDVLVDVDRAAWSREALGHGYVRILRTDLVDILLTKARNEGIPIHWGKSLCKITENDQAVKVAFSDQTEATADLLLGCDGIHSAVRGLHISPTAEPEYSGISNMYSIVPTWRLTMGKGVISEALHGVLTPEGLIAVTPATASGDHVYWFYSREVQIPDAKNDREGWTTTKEQETAGFKGRVLQVLEDANGTWTDVLRNLVNNTDTVKFYPVYKMPSASAWSTKRCLLLGDSAHAMQPHVGQGTSMAMEDVFLLSRLLAQDSFTLDEVFGKYETVRRPRVEAIARAAGEGGDMRKDTSSWRLRLKEIVIKAGFRLYDFMALQRWGVGMNQKEIDYDIMEVEI